MTRKTEFQVIERVVPYLWKGSQFEDMYAVDNVVATFSERAEANFSALQRRVTSRSGNSFYVKQVTTYTRERWLLVK